MKKKTNTALLLIVVIGIAILIGSLAIMLPGIEDAPEDTDRTPTVTTDPTVPGDPEDSVVSSFAVNCEGNGVIYRFIDGDETNNISSNSTRVIGVYADTGGVLPPRITVTGASYTWNKTSGVLEIFNATSDVYIFIDAVVEHSVKLFAKNCGVKTEFKLVKEGSDVSFFPVRPLENYIITDECIELNGHYDGYTYNPVNGQLDISGVYSDILVEITPIRDPDIPVYKVNVVGDNFDWYYLGDANGTISPGEQIEIEATVGTFDYLMPKTIKVIGADYTWSVYDSHGQSSAYLKIFNVTSNVQIIVEPIRLYSVTFVGDEYFDVYLYEAQGTDDYVFTFAEGEFHRFVLKPIEGYKISNVEFEGIDPSVCMLETNINGQYVGAMFSLGGIKPTSYDIKIVVSVEKLSSGDTHTLKLNDTEYGTGTFDVDSLTFSPGKTIEFIAYFDSDQALDTLQLYADDDDWIIDGFEFSCIGYNGFSVITMTFSDDDNFVSVFGSEPKEFELCLSTYSIVDTDVRISVDTGGECLGGPTPSHTNPGGAIIVNVYYPDGYTCVDGWSYTGPDGTDSPDWVEVDLRTINGRDYIIFKFADDAPGGILMFSCWFA